jgi:hypothetical protein
LWFFDWKKFVANFLFVHVLAAQNNNCQNPGKNPEKYLEKIREKKIFIRDLPLAVLQLPDLLGTPLIPGPCTDLWYHTQFCVFVLSDTHNFAYEEIFYHILHIEKRFLCHTHTSGVDSSYNSNRKISDNGDTNTLFYFHQPDHFGLRQHRCQVL